MTHQPSAGPIDFSRTMLRFRSTRVNHTPRVNVDAACTLTPPGGTAATYYLTSPCIAEEMYIETGLIHEPASEFAMIALPRHHFVTLKRHGDGRHDQRALRRFGEPMPTHDGRGATMVELDVTVRHHEQAVPITGYDEFREALLGDHGFVARTTFTDDDGTLVEMEYPCRCVNITNDARHWQVDAGPVLMPAAPIAAAELPAASLDLAYIVFNQWDYAEAVLRRPAAAGAEPSPCHYALRRAIRCRHELFRVHPGR
jgi:hypothetical protein